jgi:pyruvate/2-oxoglutarate dehydrogenase complex dihydrolipoamide acyltransferase (E2) component
MNETRQLSEHAAAAAVKREAGSLRHGGRARRAWMVRASSLRWAAAALAGCSSPPAVTADPARCDAPVASAAAAAAVPETLSAPAVRVEVIEGNVVAWDGLGRHARLTREGVDAAASLAPDGRHVAFLRSRRAASDVRDLHEVDILSGLPRAAARARSPRRAAP